MKIKVYQDRYLIEDKDISVSQYENLATTLFFEFPEFVDKNGENIETNKLNKYIVFDIDDEENQDIILDNKYSFPYEITKREEITFYIKLQEGSLSEDMSDKLIWISKGITISFNKTKDGKTTISNEKLDAFNSIITTLNLKTEEVDNLIKDVELKVESGEFNGKDGLTPYIQDKYWYIGEENTNIRAEGKDGLNGKDYVLTEEDKTQIKKEIKENVEYDIKPTIDNIEYTAETAVNIAKGANQSIGFKNYQEVVTAFNVLPIDTYRVGQNIYVKTRFVPDLWVYEIFEESIPYTYTNDEEFIELLNSENGIRIGHYSLGALETQKVDLTDVNQNISNLQNNKQDTLIAGEHIKIEENVISLKNEIVPIACVIKPTSSGWILVNDETRKPLNVNGVSIVDGIITLDLKDIDGIISDFVITPNKTAVKYGFVPSIDGNKITLFRKFLVNFNIFGSSSGIRVLSNYDNTIVDHYDLSIVGLVRIYWKENILGTNALINIDGYNYQLRVRVSNVAAKNGNLAETTFTFFNASNKQVTSHADISAKYATVGFDYEVPANYLTDTYNIDDIEFKIQGYIIKQ